MSLPSLFSPRSSLPWLICSCLLLAFTLIRCGFSLAWPINHDCAMYVAAGQLLLAGEKPYIDFIDINPPLIFYLNALPAWVSRISGLDVIVSFEVFVWLICLIGWVLSAVLLHLRKDRDYLYVGPLLLGYAAFNAVTGEWGEFGQRQHLAAVAMVPFFITRWLRTKDVAIPRSLSILTGILLGVMVALVPQYVLVPVAVELVFLIRTGKVPKIFTAEVLSVLACGAAYGVLFLSLPAAVKDAFLHRWLPLIAQGYGAFNGGWPTMTTFPFIIGCFPLALYGAYVATKHRCSLTVPLLVWCAAAYIVVLLQMKGWYNHYLPFLAGACMLTAVQAQAANRSNERRSNRALLIALCVLAVCTMPSILLRESMTYGCTELAVIKRETKPGDTVAILSTNVPDVYPPLLQAGCINGSRYLFLFPILMLHWCEEHARSQGAKDQAQRQEQVVLGDLRSDLAKSSPKLILIPIGITKAEQEASLSAYFIKVGLLKTIEDSYDDIGLCQGRLSTFRAWRLKRR